MDKVCSSYPRDKLLSIRATHFLRTPRFFSTSNAPCSLPRGNSFAYHLPRSARQRRFRFANPMKRSAGFVSFPNPLPSFSALRSRAARYALNQAPQFQVPFVVAPCGEQGLSRTGDRQEKFLTHYAPPLVGCRPKARLHCDAHREGLCDP